MTTPKDEKRCGSVYQMMGCEPDWGHPCEDKVDHKGDHWSETVSWPNEGYQWPHISDRLEDSRLLDLLLTASELLQGTPSMYGTMGADESWLDDRSEFLMAVADIMDGKVQQAPEKSDEWSTQEIRVAVWDQTKAHRPMGSRGMRSGHDGPPLKFVTIRVPVKQEEDRLKRRARK